MKEQLTGFIKKQGADAYVIHADSATNADLYYVTRFLSHDPFLYVHSEGRGVLLISDMEAGRAEKQAGVEEVIPFSRYKFTELVKKGTSPEKAYLDIVAELLEDLAIQKIAVPQTFDIYLADGLRSKNFDVMPVKSPVRTIRARKSEGEISFIKGAQDAAERAIGCAENALKKSKVKEDTLYFNGEPLTSEILKNVIEVSLLQEGYETDSTIVSSGISSADPHDTGTGPIRPDEPIVIDVFPRHKINRYYGDVSRTLLWGTPPGELEDMYEAVLAAQQTAIELVKEGIQVKQIHGAVCEVFESKGYATNNREGFIHSTGHGVGLEVHESPNIGMGSETLQSGNVITIEPGLYYKNIGAVRIEDILVVTKKSCINLNTYPKRLLIEGTG